MTSNPPDAQARAVIPEPSARLRNARKILDAAWDAGAVSAAELMAATGLTRVTVLNQARELADARWLREAQDSRALGQYSTGRPALRYELETATRAVAGIDAGQHRISAVLADPHGSQLARAQADIHPEAPAAQRVQVVAQLLRELGESQASRTLDALVVGVPAPVDSRGFSPSDANGFWGRMNPDWQGQLGEFTGLIQVENDANLAARAELGRGADGSFAALLVGERLGAGTVVDGQLLRGAHGMAGEMRFLTHVQGVGSAAGLGPVARQLADDALAAGRSSSLAGLEQRGTQQIFAAAHAHDELACEILEALGLRLARIAAVIAGFAGLETIIVSGAMAATLAPVIQIAQRELDREPAPVRLSASSLGAEAVVHGALRSALDLMRATAPNLPTRKAP